jgi:uncharacterized protein (TIGR02453 family)
MENIMDSQSFPGFPKEGVQFLADLARNNNREWFQANKRIFQEQLQIPAQQFVLALGMRLQEISPDIRFDTRTNGSGSLMRIYRDIRFSKDKTPYKTHISMAFWEGSGKKLANPAFLVRFEPGGGGIYAGQHVFDKDKRNVFREAVIDDQMGYELEEALAEVGAFSNYEIGGEHYKRVPRGYDTEHPRADYLKYNGLWAVNPTAVKEADLYKPELIDICFEQCQRMDPIQRWLVKLDQRI